MVKRLMFYDPAKDGSRLAAEYLQTTPAAWTHQYLAPHQVYKYTTVGALDYCVLVSEPDAHDFEAEMLFKATNADAMVGLTVRKGRTTTNDTGQVCFWLTGGFLTMEFTTSSGATPVLSAPAYVVDPNKWQRLKVRCVGRHYKCKVWPEDVAEPDWLISLNCRYVEIRHVGTIALRAGIRTAYFKNIRWTPIPRTGGP